MSRVLVALLLLLLPIAQGFFTMGGCSCPPAACAPSPSCQPACPPPPPCAVVHAAKTQVVAPLGLPDELELRAAAFGVALNGPSNPTANIEQLERLVDHHDEMQADETVDEDTFNQRKEIRRAPVVSVSQKIDMETTTAAPFADKVKEEEATIKKCNSPALQRLMMESMTDNSSESKKKVNTAAEAKFGGNVDVICSRGHFSYVFSSNMYCEVTKGLTTCIAFRQA